MLTEHGCFRKYLHKYRRSDSKVCLYCNEVDDIRHTFFSYPRWAEIRSQMALCAGEDVRPENIVGHMLQPEENWDKISKCIAQIVKSKESEEKILIRRQV